MGIFNIWGSVRFRYVAYLLAKQRTAHTYQIYQCYWCCNSEIITPGIIHIFTSIIHHYQVRLLRHFLLRKTTLTTGEVRKLILALIVVDSDCQAKSLQY